MKHNSHPPTPKNKVLLLSPQINYFPVSFAYIIPCLKRNNIVYDFVDLNIDPDFLKNNSLIDYYAVAVGGLIGHFFMLSNLFDSMRKINPNVSLILGGRVTGAPEYMLQKFPADYFIFGEADPALPNLLQALSNMEPVSEIKGIAYRDNDNNYIKTQPERKLPLDKFNPCWDDIDIEYYLSNEEFATGGYYSNRSYPIIIGMGCIGQCVFCNPVIKGFRTRPPENVVAELVEAKAKYNIKSFFIDSEIFYLKFSDVEKFCGLLKENNINLNFAASIRADADPDIIQPLSEAGCKTLMIGIEAYDNSALKAMNKRITTDDIDRIVFAAQKNNIHLIAGFLVGNPGDTEESILKTTDFIIENNIVCPIRPMGLMIYPSTMNYTTAIQKNLINDEWDFFKKFCNFSYSIRITENGIGKDFPNLTPLSNDELWSAYAKASFKLYNHFMTKKVLRNAQLANQTAHCYHCNTEIAIKKPVWLSLCPECGHANYCDVHMMGLMSEKQEELAAFCAKNSTIAITGTYHFKMALLKLCLDNGKSARELFIVEDNEQLKNFFCSFYSDLRVISQEMITEAESVLYAGLFLPERMDKRLQESGFLQSKILNSTPDSYKSLHKKNLYNQSYYFEFTDKYDLHSYGEKVAEYLKKNYEEDTCWVLYSNCPLGEQITKGILQSGQINAIEYSNTHSEDNTGKIMCLITTPRMTGYADMINELSKAFSIPKSDVLGLKKDICAKMWSHMLISE